MIDNDRDIERTDEEPNEDVCRHCGETLKSDGGCHNPQCPTMDRHGEGR